MDDRHIQELTRMAMEVEALERSASGEEAPIVFSRAVAPRPIHRLMVGAGLGLAAAACLVLGFVILRATTPPPVVKPGPAMAGTDRGSGRHGSTGAIGETRLVSNEKCVVMSMYRDASGHCSC